MTDPLPGTCEWVSADPKYIEWNALDCSGVLWLCSHPGRGKSVLTKYLITRAQLLQHANSAIAFFFCDAKNVARRNQMPLLSSILHQILKQVPALLIPILPTIESMHFQIGHSVEALWQIFRRVVQNNTIKRCTIFIDGLDELQLDDRRAFCKQLTKTVSSLQNISKGIHYTKFVVTSRPEETFIRAFEDIAQCILLETEMIEPDIRRFSEKVTREFAVRENISLRMQEQICTL